MENPPLLFFLISTVISFGFIGFLAYLNYTYSIPLIRYYLTQLTAYSFFVILHSLSLYGFLNTDFYSDYWKTIMANMILELFFIGPLIYYQGRIFFYVSETPWVNNVKYPILAIAAIPPFIAFLVLIDRLSPIFTSAGMGLWLLCHFSYTVLLIHRYSKINNPLHKLIAGVFFIFSAFFITIAVTEVFVQAQRIKIGEYPKGILAHPLILLINNVLSLYVLMKAKTMKGYSQKLPQTFLLQYKITSGEMKIIEMLCKGLSNKEIASKLFLSPGIVRNHISKILEKTATSTRGKLQNLVQSYSYLIKTR